MKWWMFLMSPAVELLCLSLCSALTQLKLFRNQNAYRIHGSAPPGMVPSARRHMTRMQSWSRSIRCFLGKTRHNAARTKVPAHVGWMFCNLLAQLMRKKTRSHSSWAGPVNKTLLFHHAATVGQWASDSSVVVSLVRYLLSTKMKTVSIFKPSTSVQDIREKHRPVRAPTFARGIINHSQQEHGNGHAGHLTQIEP